MGNEFLEYLKENHPDGFSFSLGNTAIDIFRGEVSVINCKTIKELQQRINAEATRIKKAQIAHDKSMARLKKSHS